MVGLDRLSGEEGLAMVLEGPADNSGQDGLSLALGLSLAVRVTFCCEDIGLKQLLVQLNGTVSWNTGDDTCYLSYVGELGEKEDVTCC